MPMRVHTQSYMYTVHIWYTRMTVYTAIHVYVHSHPYCGMYYSVMKQGPNVQNPDAHSCDR